MYKSIHGLGVSPSFRGFLIIERYISNCEACEAFEDESQLRKLFASLGVDLMKNELRDLTDPERDINCPGYVLDQASPTEHGILPLDASLSEARTEHPGDVRCTESTTKTVPLSVPGLVDAILEVSRQRKTILDQVRSALLSGNDMEALQFARNLCGLPVKDRNEEGYRTHKS